MSITVPARAKLNLSLDVQGKRADGYHDMRMVMQSVLLHDDVSVVFREPGFFKAETNRSYIPCDERNVAVKAAKEFFSAAGIADRGAYIKIEKRIPVCAGLGGGSTDAAAVLLALNELTGLRLGAKELVDIAARVGSDVPYCVLGGTALAEGRGEVLTELPALEGADVVICMPYFTVSTPEFFTRIDARASRCRPDTEGLIAAIAAGELREVARRMYNVFEDVLERRASDVNAIKSALLDNGALGAAMSGTGSAVFGLFPDEETATAAGEAMKDSCREIFVTKTCGKTV